MTRLEVLLSLYGRRRPTLAELLALYTRRPVRVREKVRT